MSAKPTVVVYGLGMVGASPREGMPSRRAAPGKAHVHR